MRFDILLIRLSKVIFVVFLALCFKTVDKFLRHQHKKLTSIITEGRDLMEVFMEKSRNAQTYATEPSMIVEEKAKTVKEMENMTLKEIREEINYRNLEQRVRNVGGQPRLALGPDSVVMVVQVRDRPEYLQRLIASLSDVSGIDQTLLIFSHDVFSPPMIKMVRGIMFCPVLQIFYPYSPQLFPDRFPGQSAPALNCSQQGRDIDSTKKERGAVISPPIPSPAPPQLKQSAPQKERSVPKILNRRKPPSLRKSMPNLSSHSFTEGNVKMSAPQPRNDCSPYVPCALCQAKHHWAWMLNFVFRAVRRLRGFEGHVMLLEEDYYVTRDLLHTARLMPTSLVDALGKVKRSSKDSSGMVISAMGCLTYPTYLPRTWKGGEATFRFWEPKYKIGLLFTRSFWLALSQCAKQFCQYEDYGWDWSLLNVSRTCFQSPLIVASLNFMRVHHMGKCVGMLDNLADTNATTESPWCDLPKVYDQMMEYLGTNKRLLFPETLRYDTMLIRSKLSYMPRGGWEAKDHDLCESFFTQSGDKLFAL